MKRIGKSTRPETTTKPVIDYSEKTKAELIALIEAGGKTLTAEQKRQTKAALISMLEEA